jgi:hypothetical protein
MFLYIRLEGKTREPLEAVRWRLEKHLEGTPDEGSGKGWFSGWARGDKFRLVRTSWPGSFFGGRASNMVRPIVFGRLEAIPGGTRVIVVLTLSRLLWFVLLVTFLGFVGWGLNASGHPVSLLTRLVGVQEQDLGVLPLFWLCTAIAFYWKVGPVRRLLTAVLRVKLREPEKGSRRNQSQVDAAAVKG